MRCRSRTSSFESWKAENQVWLLREAPPARMGRGGAAGLAGAASRSDVIGIAKVERSARWRPNEIGLDRRRKRAEPDWSL